MEIWSSPWHHAAVVLMQPQVLINTMICLWALWTMTSLVSTAALCNGSWSPGVTVLIAVVHMLITICLQVIQFSIAAVVPTYSFWFFLSGEMHCEMTWELSQMLEEWKLCFCSFVRTNHWFSFDKKEPLPPCYNLVRLVKSIPFFCHLCLSHLLPSHLVICCFYLVLCQLDKPKAQMCLVDGEESAVKKGWGFNSGNHSQPVESWSEVPIGCSDRKQGPFYSLVLWLQIPFI